MSVLPAHDLFGLTVHSELPLPDLMEALQRTLDNVRNGDDPRKEVEETAEKKKTPKKKQAGKKKQTAKS